MPPPAQSASPRTQRRQRAPNARLLARTREEAALRIYQHQRLLEQNAAARIIPLVQDMMHGDGTKAAEQRAAAAADNARHICDVIHTVLCMAKKRFDGGRPVSREQALSEWLPDPGSRHAPHPYYVTGFLVNQTMDAKRQLHPLALAGSNKPVTQGFGTGAPFKIGYTFAPNVFRRFQVRVGFHPTAGKKAAVRFEIHANGKPIHQTKLLRRDDDPVLIDAQLPGVGTLKLDLVTIPDTPTDSLENLVVWADPTLLR